jgi:6-pyruvoyltetrahydropterin/6-carboxytetrahydropterin synthase
VEYSSSDRAREEARLSYQDLDLIGAAAKTAPEAPRGPTTALVSRRASFNAAHQLADSRLSPEENQRLFGKCARVHGHNYVLEVAVAGEIDPATGYVFDLKSLAEIMQRLIVDDVDHRNLNTEVAWLAGRIPTAENLAVAFWERLASALPDGTLRSVRVWESEKNWAEVGERV